ncbi:hypothetical protein U9M48_005884 [Paspalum notatum var. saurae]|uniref:Uncharacterized protein n=1 Tax=Paspalum notatum var. saurae TaxID=547442 RepID=A0AAQ3SIY1_PASNO
MPVRRRRPHRCPPLSPTGSLAHRPSSTRRTAAAPRNHRGEALAGSAREEEQDATHLEIRPTTALPSLLIEFHGMEQAEDRWPYQLAANNCTSFIA